MAKILPHGNANDRFGAFSALFNTIVRPIINVREAFRKNGYHGSTAEKPLHYIGFNKTDRSKDISGEYCDIDVFTNTQISRGIGKRALNIAISPMKRSVIFGGDARCGEDEVFYKTDGKKQTYTIAKNLSADEEGRLLNIASRGMVTPEDFSNLLNQIPSHAKDIDGSQRLVEALHAYGLVHTYEGDSSIPKVTRASSPEDLGAGPQ